MGLCLWKCFEKYLGGVKHFISHNQYDRMNNYQFPVDHKSFGKVSTKYCIYPNISNFIKKDNRNLIFKKQNMITNTHALTWILSFMYVKNGDVDQHVNSALFEQFHKFYLTSP